MIFRKQQIYLVCRREKANFEIIAVCASASSAEMFCNDEHDFYFQVKPDTEIGKVEEVYPCRAE